MGTLADRIDSLPTQNRHLEDWSNTRTAWLAGFDTGLYEAANLAKEADELMEEMVCVLDSASHGYVCQSRAEAMLNKYNAWKERTK